MADIQRQWIRRVLGILLLAGVALVILANVHLVYVAVTSQPDCVPHRKQPGEAKSRDFRAAKPGC